MAGKSATEDGYIYIPAKRRQPIPTGQRAVVRVNSDAYNALVDIYNESTLPMAQIASMLICNAAQRVRLVKEEDDEAVRD